MMTTAATPQLEEGIARVADLLVQRRHGVAMTGAGISVDSGIPDFRSPGGLWEQFDPMEYATIQAFRADPHKVWQMLTGVDELLKTSSPNPGHEGLARLERAGVMDGIVTQNIDNLHQRAGSQRVVEFHGNGSRLVCLACSSSVETVELKEIPPRCSCGEILKPDVVFFGEMIPEQALRGSMELVEACEVMLVVGTSGTVAPASLIPMAAKRKGALVAEFNLEPTEITAVCDVVVHASASVTLPMLAERVEQLLG